MKPKLLTFKKHGYSGYELKEVNRYMKKLGLLKKWQQWSMGITGGLEGNKMIIYKWDFDNFMAGKPNLD
jgi:hypothetical protein